MSRSDRALVGLIWSAPLFAAHAAAFIEAWAEIACGSGLAKRAVGGPNERSSVLCKSRFVWPPMMDPVIHPAEDDFVLDEIRVSR